MAASRSVLEALLARVQKRAQEPRTPALHVPPLPAVDVASAVAGHAAAADTLPPEPAAAFDANVRTLPPAPPSLEVTSADDDVEEEVEEYDEELIEIIDDSDVIPQAAAAARAIDPGAFGANLERRGAPAGKAPAAAAPVAAAPRAAVTPAAAAPAPAAVAPRAPAPAPAAAPRAPTPAPAAAPRAPAPAVAVRAAAPLPTAPVEPLRPEVVVARPVAPGAVTAVRGGRRELRSTPFLELLDASLQLGR